MILTISPNEIRIIDIIEITIKTADMIEVVPRKDIEIVSTAEMTGLVSMIGMIGTEMVSIVEIDRERDIGTSPETPTGISPETTIEMRLTIDTVTVSIEIVLEIDIEIIRSMIGMLDRKSVV